MTDINEIMMRDPLSLTRTDLEQLVSAFRSARKQFTAGNIKAGSTKPKTPKQKEAAAIAKNLSLDLGDLGI